MPIWKMLLLGFVGMILFWTGFVGIGAVIDGSQRLEKSRIEHLLKMK